MDSSELKKILDDHNLWLRCGKGARADLNHVDLSCADLHYDNLSNADLHCVILCTSDLSGANLFNANLCDADLCDANLSDADLRYVNLCGADLRNADLSNADLSHANLSNADLSDADLDFSCWGLSCRTFDVSVSMRLVYQLCYHICKLKCENEEFTLIKNLLKPFANKFHRVDECGKIE